ncbi:MAG: tRNA (adenosine(37)-N6)-threonylcarbamoyltransferase complex dimerization subunit type 1 TsaB [Clostridia bacterium]|nr:tRNA (adenosine(37)-N6)-threonylcarbamoyltransferase complex dimerization subunit type 1 TsaB [Clostridia bacterium]
MKILALDSTAVVGTVALCEDERLIAHYTLNTGNTHSQTLLPMIESILRSAEWTVDDVELFAVSQGPGSFTGVRIGISTVKGLAFGKNIPCAGVSTLEALAYNLRYCNGIICPVMNARRAQVYNALFSCKDGVLTRLCPDRAISIAELDEELAAMDQPVYLVGDGYDITLEGFFKTTVMPVPEEMRSQSGYSVALCGLTAYKNGAYTDDTTLAPVYLRPSQAERERNERLANQNT